MKIKCTQAKISNFPKKDINIIVAFLTEGLEEPLVLCSNGCTLWYSTVIEYFKIIPISSPKWKDLEHVPFDPKKINPQNGDVMYIDDMRDKPLRVTNLYGPRDEVAADLYDPIHNNYHIIGYKKHLTMDCIPLPRIAVTKKHSFTNNYGYHNMYGQTISDENSAFLILNTKPDLTINKPEVVDEEGEDL